MEKHWDIAFGSGGTVAVITLAQFNQALACGAGLLTLAILALRLGREWRNRNQPPKDQP
jgi:hypothetical protein